MSKRRSDKSEPKAGCSKDLDTTISQTVADNFGDVEVAGSSCKKTKFTTPVKEWTLQLVEEVRDILTSDIHPLQPLPNQETTSHPLTTNF